jgi:hypothetical protein
MIIFSAFKQIKKLHLQVNLEMGCETGCYIQKQFKNLLFKRNAFNKKKNNS